MTLTESLLERAVRFCSEQGMTERQFGLSVANNHKLITRLRAGFSVNSQTHDRILAFIGDSKSVRSAKHAPAILAAPERELLAAFRSTDRHGRELILRLVRSLRSDAPAQRAAAE
jgi:hypothetical protein